MAAASRMDHPRLSPRPRLGGRSRNHHLGLAFPPVPSLPRRSGPLPRISPGRAPSPASTASAPRIPASAASPRGAEAAARSQGAPKRRPVPVNPGRRVCLRFPLPRRKGLPCPPVSFSRSSSDRESRGLRQDGCCLIDLGLHGVGECAKKLAAEKAAKFREETSEKAGGMASRRARYNVAASDLTLNLCNAAESCR